MTNPEPTWRPLCVLCAARDRVRRLDAGHVCPECVQWLTGTLRAVSDLVAQAAVAGDRQRVGSSTGKPVFGSRPPMDVECLDPDLTLVRVCDAPPYPTLLEVLEAWERLVREARTLAPYGPASLARGGASVHGSVGFLVASVEWITSDTGFPIEDFADELRACLRAVRKWDEDAAARGYAVPCPTVTDEVDEETGEYRDCGYRLRFVEADEDVTCRRCQVTRSVSQLVAVGMATKTHEMWVDPEVVMRRYGITESTMKRWARAGHVQRSHGRYLLSDLESIMAVAAY